MKLSRVDNIHTRTYIVKYYARECNHIRVVVNFAAGGLRNEGNNSDWTRLKSECIRINALIVRRSAASGVYYLLFIVRALTWLLRLIFAEIGG